MTGISSSTASWTKPKNALINYFNYSSNIQSVYKSNYSESAWADLIKEELNSLRPLLYRGGSHAFICDGYQDINYFHFNWGWNGAYDGYYYLSSLNPGEDDFTSGQGAILKIFPNTIPDAAKTIVGLTTVCQGQTSVTYTVPTILKATSYIWTLPAGATGTSTTNSIIVSFSSTAQSGSIKVKGTNSIGSGVESSLLITITSSIPSQPSAITGTASVCQGTSQTYSVTNVSGVNYNWTFPSGWVKTAGGNTNSITVTVGSGSGTITVTPSNGCGSGTARTLAVTVSTVPSQPSTITGATAVTQGSSQIYSITNITGVSYNWTLPSGWIKTGGGNTNAITVTVGSESGNISVTPSNTCGNGTARTLAVTVNSVPSQPSEISGASIVCQGASKTYSVTNVSGVNYNWTFPSGWVQTAGGNTNFVTVTVGSGSGTISVTPSNSFGSGTSRSMNVSTTTSTPSQPSVITGATSVCQGSSQVYNVTNVSGVTYNWTVPSGWVITGGGSTNAITLTAGSGSGSISVTPSNVCGNGTARTLNINTSLIPVQPSPISGSSTVCQGSSQTYSVTNIAGITYNWTLPSGWLLTGGGNTNAITVTVGSSSGSINVLPSNSCGNGISRSLAVTTTTSVPTQPSVITGQITVCQGSLQTYSVTNQSAVQYKWEFPSGWIQTDGGTTNIVKVIVGTSNGIISVTPKTDCGSGIKRTMSTSVKIIPTTPIISITGNILHSDASSGNQWFYNNNLLDGETKQDLNVTKNGVYYSIVTLSGCSSTKSNIITTNLDLPSTVSFQSKSGNSKIDSIIITNLRTCQKVLLTADESLILHDKSTGINQLKNRNENAIIYPNPCYSNAFLNFYNENKQKVKIVVHNISGQELGINTQDLLSGNHVFNLKFPLNGIYIVSVIKEERPISFKVICSGLVQQKFNIEYVGSENSVHMKNVYADKYVDYQQGDVLLYSVYSGKNTTIVTDSPNGSAVYSVEFHECIDADGLSYPIVKINDQWWMAKNLQTTKYNEGTPIPSITEGTFWAGLKTGAFCYYNNSAAVSLKFGGLYNFYAVNDSRNLCPSGWHVPSDNEWNILSNSLGGSNFAGGKLKEVCTSYWIDPNTKADNSSGFSALPGGYRRYVEGIFTDLTEYGYWWSSTEYSATNSWNSYLSYNNSNLGRKNNNKINGFNVRCIKNNIPPPTVITNEVSSLTQNSAICGGNISSNEAIISSRGICWNTSGHPTITDNVKIEGIGTGTFSSSLSQLLSNTTYYVRAFATYDFGTVYGNEINFILYLNVPGPVVTDSDGNTYKSVKIGSQIWLSENLKTTKYSDGSNIPNVTGNTAWGDLKAGAYCWYNNDISNRNVYGCIYNWHAVSTGKLCPSGWHVPSHNEQLILVNYLGGDSIAGGKMKFVTGWNSPNTNADNSSGFNSLPGGARSYTGSFSGIGSSGIWWASIQANSISGWYMNNTYNSAGVAYSYVLKERGYNVRCIKD